MAWAFLVGNIVHVAPFLEVGAFIPGQASVDNEMLHKLCGSKGNVVDWFIQPIGIGSLHQSRAPNTIGRCGEDSPSIDSSKHFGIGIPSVEDGSKFIVIGKLLQFVNGGGELTPFIVGGELLGGVVLGWSSIKASQHEGSNRPSAGAGGCALQSTSRCNQSGKAIVWGGSGVCHG